VQPLRWPHGARRHLLHLPRLRHVDRLRLSTEEAYRDDADVSELYGALLSGRVVAPDPHLSQEEQQLDLRRTRGALRAAEDGYRLGGNWWDATPGYYLLGVYRPTAQLSGWEWEAAIASIAIERVVALVEAEALSLDPGAPLQACDLDPWQELRAEAERLLRLLRDASAGTATTHSDWREPYGCFFEPVEPLAGVRQLIEERVAPVFIVHCWPNADGNVIYRLDWGQRPPRGLP
jgi:hypothetical protein